MATEWREVLKQMQRGSALLRRANREMLNAYQAVREANHGNEALDAKTRELIAIAVAIARQCDGCIASHIRQAKQAGATREEIGAAAGVAMHLGVGSAYVYSLKALEAYEQV